MDRWISTSLKKKKKKYRSKSKSTLFFQFGKLTNKWWKYTGLFCSLADQSTLLISKGTHYYTPYTWQYIHFTHRAVSSVPVTNLLKIDNHIFYILFKFPGHQCLAQWKCQLGCFQSHRGKWLQSDCSLSQF